MKPCYTVAIVGGGLTGIMAARILREKGMEDVILIEKNSSVGGRMATCLIEPGIVDYGAQFFTARSPILQSYVSKWLQANWIKRWFGNTYPRYTSTTGMNSLAKHLAMGIETKLNTRVNSIDEKEEGFILSFESGESLQARSVILTAPAPQTEMMLYKGRVTLNENVMSTLSSIHFQPSLVALLTLNRPSRIPATGHLDKNLPEEIERIVDHQKKAISSSPTISVYMKPEWSLKAYNEKDEVLLKQILQLTEGYIEPDSIQTLQLKRWKYSEAIQPVRMPYLLASLSHPLFIAGDAFLFPDDPAGRTRIESAFLSGLAVGEELYQHLQKRN